MQIPETRYARVGDIRIAYQMWGEGPPLIIIPAFISNIEISWEHELYRRTLEYMGKHMTYVMFDKRGMGLSDRFEDVPTLEQRIEDILAVMDAVGWERAHIFGVSEGGAMAQLFAADYPHRTESADRHQHVRLSALPEPAPRLRPGQRRPLGHREADHRSVPPHG